MVKLLAPTNLIILISLLRAEIVNLIVFTIKNMVTNVKAIAIPNVTFSTDENALTILSTISSP